MSASKQAKEAGLNSLAQVSEITGVSVQTLTNWYHDKPKLFEAVLLGARFDMIKDVIDYGVLFEKLEAAILFEKLYIKYGKDDK